MDDKPKSGVHQGLILDGHKLLWHRERLEAWQAGERIPPITIDCSLTRACNYRCLYCYGQLQNNRVKHLGKDVIFRFLDDAADIGVKAVSFVSDGESTCSPHLYDAICRGKANGLDMALGTNGYSLKLDRLIHILPKLTYLRFNISAGTPKAYAKIHGVPENFFEAVLGKIEECVKIKKLCNLDVTIGLQMVLMPEFKDEIIPLVQLGRMLGVDYTVIKHCSDDEFHSLGVDYEKYYALREILETAESMSTDFYQVAVKWSKIMSGGKREYRACYGPAFIMQFSGSGLVAPCGMLFNDRYKKHFHIGNIADESFKSIWKGERYREVLNRIGSASMFDPGTMCGSLCLQHKCNEFLFDLALNGKLPPAPEGPAPQHVNFV